MTTGLPSTFVRLATCNLRCSWCDTRYSWDWADYDPKQEITTLAAGDIASRVRSTSVSNVVITGGEPLLQMPGVAELATNLKAAGLRIEVETNGTIAPSGQLAEAIDQWNVSPKLTSSGNPTELREIPDALHWFAGQPNAYLKFVVDARPDVDEAMDLAMRYGAPEAQVVLMPQGMDAESIRERSLWLADECQQRGVRFSTRLHILLWGPERGR